DCRRGTARALRRDRLRGRRARGAGPTDLSRSRCHRRATLLLRRARRAADARGSRTRWFAARGSRGTGCSAAPGLARCSTLGSAAGCEDGAWLTPLRRALERPMSRVKKAPRPRVIVVAKQSALARLERGEGDARARSLLRGRHEAVKKWRPAHDEHEKTLRAVEAALEELGADALFLRGPRAEFDPSGSDLVVTVGGDGTLLAASHSIRDVPILGINSAPGYSVGFFCAATRQDLVPKLRAALSGRLRAAVLRRMAVYINDQLRSERVLNEALFCHSEPAATSDYILRVGRQREEQKSSG